MTDHCKLRDKARETLLLDLNTNLANPQLDPDERTRRVALYFKLSDDVRADEKLALDREKLTLENRKLELLERKIEAAVEIARVRAESPPSTAKRSSATAPHEPPAPYGNKPDGAPYTHAEFCELLDQAVADIYGFDIKTGNLVPRDPEQGTVNEPSNASPDPPSGGDSPEQFHGLASPSQNPPKAATPFRDDHPHPASRAESPRRPVRNTESVCRNQEPGKESTKQVKHRVDKIMDMPPDHPHRQNQQRDPCHHQPHAHVRRQPTDRLQTPIQFGPDGPDP